MPLILVSPSDSNKPFSNGYARRFEIVIGKSLVFSPLTDFELLVSETIPSLKTVTNNGFVTSTNGYDIRFESKDGIKLPHAMISYDGTIGKLVTIVKVPQITSSINTIIYMYVGNSSVVNISTDLFLNPFNSDSHHHMPIGTGATYAGTSDAAYVDLQRASGFVSLNSNNGYGKNVFKATNSDPLKTITWNNQENGYGLGPTGPANPGNIRFPANATITNLNINAVDRGIAIIAPDGKTVYELRGYNNNSASPQSSGLKIYDASGLGYDTGSNRWGFSASGVGNLFGLLRGFEFNNTSNIISHVLQLALSYNNSVAWTQDHGGPILQGDYLFPANGVDSRCNTDSSSCTGSVKYGTRFAIPPVSKGGPDLNTLGLTSREMQLAVCLRDFGVMVIDGTNSAAMRCDQGWNTGVIIEVRDAMRALWDKLRRVTNGTTVTGKVIGGGTSIGGTNTAWDIVDADLPKEENPTVALANWFSLWSLPTTTDYTGNGNNLTITGTIATNSSVSWGKSAILSGSGLFSRTGFSALSSAQVYSIVALAKASTVGTNKGLLSIDESSIPGNQNDASMNLVIRHDATSGGTASATGVQASPSDILADAVGVNVHLEYTGTVYDTGYGSIVKPRLVELGTRHIRSGPGGPSLARYNELAGLGIKLLLINTSYTADQTYISSNLSFIEALEGRNEPDVFDSANWNSTLKTKATAFYNTIKGNTAISHLPILMSPLGHANNLEWWHTNFPTFGSFCDVGSLHDYCNDGQKTIPESLVDNGGGGWVGFGKYWSNNQVENIYRQDLGNVKPIWDTEIGPRYDGTTASTEHQAAKAVARHLMTRVLAYGRKRLYFYQLIENSTSENFGLLNSDGTPRQPFNTLRNIVNLFKDPGVSFSASKLDYTLSGVTSDMRSYLLQKRDGKFYFIIWRGLGDTAGNFLTTESTRATVTLTLNTLVDSAKRYEPTLAVDLAASLKQTYSAPTSITFTVPDHPVVIEFTPTNGSATTTNLWATSVTQSDGVVRAETGTNSQSTAWQMVTISKATGEQVKMGLNGDYNAQTYIQTPSLSGNLLAPGTLRIGAGTADSNSGGWSGEIGLVGIRKTALTIEHARALDWSWRLPKSFYSISSARKARGNILPVIAPEFKGAASSTPVIFTPLSTINDPDGDSVNITNVTNGQNGFVTKTGNNVTYTPNTGFLGYDYFDITTSDNVNTINARMSVIVGSTAYPVKATNDVISVLQGQTVVITPITNDIPSTGLIILSIENPGFGTATISADKKTISYTASINHNGLDSIRYTITNGSYADSATITITVNPPVQAKDDVAFCNTTPVLISVLDNDSGNNLTITSISNPSKGTAIKSGSKILYTPTSIPFSGSDSFTYTITSDGAGTSTATVSVQAEVSATIDNVSTVAGVAIDIPVLINDIGGSLSILSSTNGSRGSSTIVGTSIRYTPYDNKFSGSDTFTYTIQGVPYQVSTSVVNVAIYPVVKAVDDIASTTIGNYVDIPVLNNDTGSGLIITTASNGTKGTTTINGTIIRYTPNNLTSFGVDTFTYTIRGNGTATSSTAMVTVYINDVVVANPDSATTISGKYIDVPVLTNDTGNNLSITVAGNGTKGTTSIIENNTKIRYTPNDDLVLGKDQYTYSIYGEGGTSSTVVNVNINALNKNIYWAGVNNGTGPNKGAPFVAAVIAANKELGLDTVRMSMDGVAGNTNSSAFTWTLRDAVVNSYTNQGTRIYAILSFRTHVDNNASMTLWQDNFRWFCRNVMDHYRNDVHTWIIDDEPDLYGISAANAVAFTRIAFEEHRAIGLSGISFIQSPPCSSIDNTYFGSMISAGLANYCDVYGFHCFYDQLTDTKMTYPVTATTANPKPRNITCGGTVPIKDLVRIAPTGYFRGGDEGWRADWFRQLYVQAKAFGINAALLFDLDRWKFTNTEWQFANFTGIDGGTYTKIEPIFTTIANTFGANRPFSNGNFEATEDGFTNWQVVHIPNQSTPVELSRISWPTDATKSHSGTKYMKMDLSGHTATMFVRQVADGLIVGATYTISAWVYLTGGTAILKVRGYDKLNGTTDVTATTSVTGTWTKLTVTATISNPWLVVNLRAAGTNIANQEIRWDDVTVDFLGTPIFTVSEPSSLPTIDGSGNRVYDFTISRIGDTSISSTVVWTKSGTTISSDFATGQLFTRTLTFTAGQTSQTVSFLVKPGVILSTKTINVVLSLPTNSTIDVGTASINVYPEVLAIANSYTTSLGTPIELSMLGNDTGDSIRVTSKTNGSKGATALINSGTRLRYTPTDSIVNGADTFNYTITGSGGSPSTASISMNILAPEFINKWAGISHTTVSSSRPGITGALSATQNLNVKSIRINMDSVGGYTIDTPFTFTSKDVIVNDYVNAGCELYAIVSFRSHILNRDELTWRRFVSTCLSRYSTKIKYWIIDNNPEKAPIATPRECVNFVRWFKEERDALSLTNVIISPPVDIESTFVSSMFSLGLATVCDGIGTICVGSSLNDLTIRKTWDQMIAANANLPLYLIESGATTSLMPSGYVGSPELWRSIFFRQMAMQARSYGMQVAIVSDLNNSTDAVCSISGISYNPIQPTYDAIKASFGSSSGLVNAGFEADEDGYSNWFIRHSPDNATPTALSKVSFVNDPTKARTGNKFLLMNLAGHTIALLVRQVITGLVIGSSYRIRAYARISGTTSATVRAIGYDKLNGLAEKSSSITVQNSYSLIEVITPAITNPWLVIELKGTGTNITGNEIRWDDIEVTQLTNTDVSVYAPLTPIVATNKTYNFVVNRSGNISGTSSVTWTKTGTTVSTDFISGQIFTGTLTFAPNETQKTIGLVVLKDVVLTNKNITITLSAAVNSTIGDGTATSIVYPDVKAITDTANTTTASAIDILVLNNDVGDSLYVSSVTNGNLGSVVNYGDKVRYIPNGPSFIGNDFFTYTIQGTQGNSTGTVNVTVNPAVIAVDDFATLTAGTTLDIPVLSNDSGNSLSITSVTNGNKGTTSIVSNKIRYVSNGLTATGDDVFTYIITGSGGSTSTGIVRVTINPKVAVVANDDTATVVAGEYVDIAVLANDTGNSLSVLATTDGIKGTSQKISSDTKVRYTPTVIGAGADAIPAETSDTFTYTIKDAIEDTTSTATVNINIIPESATALYQNPPSDGTIRFANPNNLTSVLSTAIPGDRIVLASGVYEGDYTLSSSGTLFNPIIIIADSLWSPQITGRFRISGQYIWVHGLTFTYNAPDIISSVGRDNACIMLIDTNNVHITRNKFRGRQGISFTYQSIWTWIGWNDFTGEINSSSSNATHSNICCVDIPAGSSGPSNFWIYNNKMIDDSKSSNEARFIYFGEGKPNIDVGTMENGNILYNYIYGSRPRIIYSRRFCNISYNYIVSTRAPGTAQIGYRYGGASSTTASAYRTIESNYVVNANIAISDPYAILKGNTVSGGSIIIYAGSSSTGDERRAASNSRLYGNNGPVIVGFIEPGMVLDINSGGKTDNSIIYRQTGIVTFTENALSNCISSPDNGGETWNASVNNLVNLTGAMIDAVPYLEIVADDMFIPEGNTGSTSIVYHLYRTGNNLDLPTTCTYVVSGDVTGFDFSGNVLPTGSITFNADETVKTISLNLLGNTVAQRNRNIVVKLTNVTNATVIQHEAYTTIVNDDAPVDPAAPQIPPNAFRAELRVPEDYATLALALAAALPGDHISLKSNIYTGDLTISQSGSNVGWIVIKSRFHKGASFSGQLNITGSYIWLYGLKFIKPQILENTFTNDTQFYSNVIRSDNTRITRCLYTTSNGIILYQNGSTKPNNVAINWNSFITTQNTFAASTSIYIGNIPSDNIGPTNVEISYNYFYDKTETTALSTDNRHSIYIGNSTPDSNSGTNLTITIRLNYLDTSYPRSIMSRRHCYIGYNYVFSNKTLDGGMFGFRDGGGGLLGGGTGVSAITADSVVDAIGVNTHLSNTGTIYDTSYTAVIKPKLLELGVRHIRDNPSANTTVRNRYKELANLGIKLQLICTNETDFEKPFVLAMKSLNGGVHVVEGVEPVNDSDNAWGSGYETRMQTMMTAMFPSYRNDSATSSLTIVGPSFANTRDSANSLVATFPLAANFMDVGNAHSYSGRDTETSLGGGWGISLSSALDRQRLSSTKPVWATATGHKITGGATGNSQVVTRSAAKYLPRTVFSHILRNSPRVYLYQLINNGESTDYGLLNSDGTNRAQFDAIKNLIGLLSDPGETFVPGKLSYNITGTMTDINQVLMQKRDGRYYLAIWQGVLSSTIFPTTAADVDATRVNLTLNLPSGISQVKVYEPSFGSGPLNTYTNPTTLSISVPDHVQILEITPSTYGTGGIIESNYIDGPGIFIGGSDAIVKGNYLPRGSIRLAAGASQSDNPALQLYRAASATVLVDNNTSEIKIGQINTNLSLDTNQGGKPHNIYIYTGDTNPTVTGLVNGSDPSGYMVTSGLGGYLSVASVTKDGLYPLVGCDTIEITPSITTNDDTVTVLATENSKDIDVLINDSGSSDLTIISVNPIAPLLTSSISIVENKVRFVRGSLSAGTYYFDYVARLVGGTLTSTSRCTITLLSSNIPFIATENNLSVPMTFNDSTVTIDILPYCTASGEILIDSVTQPDAGSVSIVSNKIVYTKNNASLGNHAFTYKVKLSSDASINATGSININITVTNNEVYDAYRIFTIDTSTKLSSVLTLASGNFDSSIVINPSTDRSGPLRAGDHLVFSDGTYPGNYTLGSSGTANAPIVLRSLNKGQAIFSGKWTLNGSDSWMIGTAHTGSNINILLSGNRSRLMRCSLSGLRQPSNTSSNSMVNMNGVDQKIMYCEFSDMDGRAVVCDNVGTKALNPYIYRSYFHDTVQPQSIHTPNREVIQFGTTQLPSGGPTVYNMNGVIDACVFERCNIHGNNDSPENQTIAINCSNNLVKNSTFIDTNFLDIQFGNNNKIESSWFEGSNEDMGISVRGDDNIILRNTFSGTKAIIMVKDGNQTQDIPDTTSGAWDGTNDNVIARRTKLISNISPLLIGTTGDTLPVLNTKIENHGGLITNTSSTGTSIVTTASDSALVPSKMDLGFVGPNAPSIGFGTNNTAVSISTYPTSVTLSSTLVTTFNFQLIRNIATAAGCSINWSLGGTMISSDYSSGQPISGTLNLTGTSLSVNIPISILAHSAGSNKTIILTISAGSNCYIDGVRTATTTIVMPAIVSGNPSGLPWTSCVWNTGTERTDFETWRGRKVDGGLAYLDKTYFNDVSSTGSWAKMTGANSIMKKDGVVHTFIKNDMKVFFSIPLCLQSEAGKFKMMYESIAARGTYYNYFSLMAAQLATWYKSTDTGLFLRLGWEGDHGYAWSLTDPPTRGIDTVNSPYYARWWASIARIFKDALPSAKFVWNSLETPPSSFKWADYYPGDDVVDVIGCDLYNNGYGASGYRWLNSDAAWDANKGAYITSGVNAGKITGPEGFLAFAKAKGKTLSFDEWGSTPDKPDPPLADIPENWDNSGGQNDAYFPQRMFKFFKDNADYIEFECYFNGNEHHQINPEVAWQTNTRVGYKTAYKPPAADTTYVYTHKPDASIIPADDSNIVIWQIPATGGTAPVGSAGKILLIWSDVEVTGPINITNSKFDAIFGIGLTIRTRGSVIGNIRSTDFKGNHIINHSFVPENSTTTLKQVLFLANINYDSRNGSENNIWGDFLRFGTIPNSTKDNYSQWMDLYLQKIYIPYGSYGFTSTTDGSGNTAFPNDPHSDITQAAYGGFRNAYIANVDAAWGYQHWFLKGADATDDKCCPDGRLFLSEVMNRGMPSNTALYGVSGYKGIVYLQNVGNQTDWYAGTNLGNYYATYLTKVNALSHPGGSSGNNGSSSPNAYDLYWVPTTVPGGANIKNGTKVTFPTYKHSSRTYPIWTGEVNFVEPTDPYVDTAEVGMSKCVKTAAQLRAIFGSATPVPVAVDDPYTIVTGTTTDFDVIANDTNAASCTLSLISPFVTHGTATISNNKVHYVPFNSTYVGTDSGKYRLTSGSNTSEATFTITHIAAGILKANPISVTINKNVTSDFDVIVVAENASGAIVSVITPSPDHGGTNIVSNKIRYNPYDAYVGTDTINYRLTKGSETSDSTVTVTIVDNALSAQADFYTVINGTTTDFNVIANDSNASGAIVSIIGASPTKGTASVVSNKIRYAATNTGTDTIHYRLTKGAETSDADVTVTINTAGVLTAHSISPTIVKGVTSDFDVLAVAENATGATITIRGTPASRGTVSVVSNKIHYVPFNSTYTGTDTIHFRLTKGAETSDADVNITIVSVNKWWLDGRSSLRSGRDWPSGVSYFSAASSTDGNLTKYEREVGYIDAINGGMPNTDASDTMEQATGGSYANNNDTILPRSNLDWNRSCHWNRAWKLMQRGTWLVWEFHTIGEDRKTETARGGNGSIWQEIIDGEWDLAYKNMGRRIRKNIITPSLNPVGHPANRIICRMNHEMNQSNYYQVYSDTRLKYKAAMEQKIRCIKIGLGDLADDVKFMHAPAHGKDIGAYDSWVPSNCDCVGLSWHPARQIDSAAEIVKYNNGTDASDQYGLTDVLNYCNANPGIPMLFPEFSPRFEWGDQVSEQRCNKIPDLCLQSFYDWLAANKDKLVCDCMYHIASITPSLCESPFAEDKAAWTRGVAKHKLLWGAPNKRP